jgi:integrase
MPRTGISTWHHKYNLLRNFFLYCKGRYGINELPLPGRKPSAPASIRVPYIYSRDEIRSLIRAINQAQESVKCIIDPKAYRTLVLFLYGTGAQIRESLSLCLEDINIRNRRITFRGGRFGRERTVPIGADLYRVLVAHIAFRKRLKASAENLFVDNHGHALNLRTVHLTFKRARRLAGIEKIGRNSPRLQDLRIAFVVHRLSAWCRSQADLRIMIPAISAYIGHVGVTSTERYLRLTPERFRRYLDILSPQPSGSRHWRDDAKLMKFLECL